MRDALIVLTAGILLSSLIHIFSPLSQPFLLVIPLSMPFQKLDISAFAPWHLVYWMAAINERIKPGRKPDKGTADALLLASMCKCVIVSNLINWSLLSSHALLHNTECPTQLCLHPPHGWCTPHWECFRSRALSLPDVVDLLSLCFLCNFTCFCHEWDCLDEEPWSLQSLYHVGNLPNSLSRSCVWLPV